MSHQTVQHLSLAPTSASGFVKIVNLDSKPYAYSNLLYYLHGFTAELGKSTQVGIRVSQASFPNVFYNVNEFNNVFAISVENPDTNIVYSYSIEIPIGNYSTKNLCASIKIALEDTFSFLNDITFDLTISELTALLTMASNYPFEIEYTTRNMIMLLGLDKNPANYPLVAEDTGTAYVYEGLRICNFLSVTNIILTSSIFKTVNMDVMTGYGFFAKIPITEGTYQMVYYTNPSDIVTTFPDKTFIDTIDLQLRDQNGQFLDFQGSNWSIILEFRFVPLPIERQTVNTFASLHNEATAKSKNKKQKKTNEQINLESAPISHLIQSEDETIPNQSDTVVLNNNNGDQQNPTEDSTQVDTETSPTDNQNVVDTNDNTNTDQADNEDTINENIMTSAFDDIFPAEL